VPYALRSTHYNLAQVNDRALAALTSIEETVPFSLCRAPRKSHQTFSNPCRNADVSQRSTDTAPLPRMMVTRSNESSIT
jgi:hypothetical protein